MSKWNWGCGGMLTIYVPRGFTHRPIQFECGSTGHDGEVVQCEKCEKTNPAPPAREMEDYGYDD